MKIFIKFFSPIKPFHSFTVMIVLQTAMVYKSFIIKIFYIALTSKPAPKDYTPKHDFNAMDCTDIVIGTARGELSRIWDYYTRDRSTPRTDTFWGGKSELQATGGFEKDGITTIVFRKKLEASEPTDHSITDDLMHVIWAKGQVREMRTRRRK